jgi:hypothetical protein
MIHHFMMMIKYYYLVANMTLREHYFLDLMRLYLEILLINLDLFILHLLFNGFLITIIHLQMMNH